MLWDWLTTAWEWLSTACTGPTTTCESGSTTIRNLGLVIAAAVALPLAIWRSTIAARQASIAQQGLLNGRYQTGAEMLGSDLLSVRLGGVYALDNLAEEYPEQYHLQIMRLFCAFIRHPNGSAGSAIAPISEEPWPQYEQDEGAWQERVLQEVILQEVIAQEVIAQDEQQPLVREDVQEIINLLRKRSDKRIALEQKSGFVPDLRGANLQHANLARMKLDRAMFSNADLSYSNLYRTSLKKAILRGAKVPSAMLNETDLSGAMLADADLSGATLENTNLSGARLYDSDSRTMVRGLTQDQLDMARADSSNPPFP